jgi:hypothetical protein
MIAVDYGNWGVGTRERVLAGHFVLFRKLQKFLHFRAKIFKHDSKDDSSNLQLINFEIE